MNRDDRHAYDNALARARSAAYGADEFVGQESFMRATDIITLATRAEITEQSTVLDLCCGVAGPGRLITREFGCAYLGVDASAAAIELARERAREMSCRFEVSRIPPLPSGAYDVVLLLETMLAFRDKEQLFNRVAEALNRGGRFAFTVEEGQPLTDSERALMPHADTVWLTPLAELLRQLDGAGLRVRWLTDCSCVHQSVAATLLTCYADDAWNIEAAVGRQSLDDLLDAHLLWSDWLLSGRVRKFSVVAEKPLDINSSRLRATTSGPRKRSNPR